MVNIWARWTAEIFIYSNSKLEGRAALFSSLGGLKISLGYLENRINFWEGSAE
jgi:hypothetical protein